MSTADPAATRIIHTGNLRAAPLNTWLLRGRRNPVTCWENGATYDPTVGKVVWYGGHIGHLYPQSNYTLLYDIERNRFVETQPLTRPQRRCLVFIAYADSCRRSINAPHGGPSHGSVPQGAFDPEYKSVVRGFMCAPSLYDAAGDDWENSRVLPPYWTPRPGAPICYEPNSDALVYIHEGKLWLYCPRTNRMHSRELPERLHSRMSQAWAADPVEGRVVLYGGLSGLTWGPGKKTYDEALCFDTWLYDVARDEWKECRPERRPPGGAPHKDSLVLPMVYHGASGTMLLLANGTDRNEPAADWKPAELWSFDVRTEQWSPVPMKDGPAFAGLMAYARNQDVLVLFGGGRDCEYRENPGKPAKLRPAHSRETRVARVRVEGKEPVPPPRPERISVVTSAKTVTVDWPAEAGGRYDVFRAKANPFPGVAGKLNAEPLASGPFVDKEIEPGQVYAYQVARAGAAGRSLPAFNQPWRPGGLLVSVESADRVVLTWQPNSEPDLAGYHVYRARGAELDEAKGARLTTSPLSEPRFVDGGPDLGDAVVRSYWVTAANRAGIESGASPLAFTVPDAPTELKVPEGVGPSNIDGEKLTYLVSWHWPQQVKVAGFNVYHAVEVINTYYYPGAWEHNRFESYFQKLNAEPIPGNELVYWLPQCSAPDHYFLVRAVNVLGQEGFYSDIVSPTDRRFRP
jgi:hypothetical protein